ncbi:MAG: shikimate dehydrogenase [Merismopedia sp. SIO2A8]|nr:shikimate dehydrogenase [Merismopedia sp. SIO2A8]
MTGPTITGTTTLLGIIGYPVEHSLSPPMQNAAIAHLGLNYVFLPFPVAPDRLADALRGFEAFGVRGFNATIPHKQAIIPLLQSVSDTARAIGAVNTIYRTDTGWCGTNTDIIGFLSPLKRQMGWTNGATVVLGNGGAARAVVAGCAQMECTQVQVVGRNPEKLQAFLASWEHSPLKANLTVHTWDELPTLLPQAKLVVNTTPVGMYPNVATSPLTLEQWAMTPMDCIAYDLIYTPSPTLFLQQAQARGAIAIDGQEMLVQQGAAALELWIDAPAPTDIMGQALRQALEQRLV